MTDEVVPTGSNAIESLVPQHLDYLRMENEVSMEESSVLSAGAWVELDDCNECGECPSEDSATSSSDVDDLVDFVLGR